MASTCRCGSTRAAAISLCYGLMRKVRAARVRGTHLHAPDLCNRALGPPAAGWALKARDRGRPPLNSRNLAVVSELGRLNARTRQSGIRNRQRALLTAPDSPWQVGEPFLPRIAAR